MTRAVRFALYLVGVVQSLLAVALFLQLPVAVGLWPYPGTTPLTFIFVASILAAAAASTLWVAVSGNFGALAGIGIDYIAVLTPLSIFSFVLGASGGSAGMTGLAIMCAIGAIFGVGLFAWGIRIPIDTTVRMPGLVRWSFVGFILALLVVSTRLLLRVPNAIPWQITPDLSVVIGVMFLGAITYFAYALLRPSWLNSAGQLIGFLAYDVVLIVPFLMRLPAVAPQFKVGLFIYTAVVIYSGLLAAYYLFVARTTRLWGAPQ
jgi:hypothetical protein